jgi:hypothetical protein
LWAGVLLGTAAAIKLFPGFLFLYFALRRQGRIAASAAISLAALTGLTAAVLGPEAYRSYAVDVLPSLERYQDEWANVSLVGLWTKLFNPQRIDTLGESRQTLLADPLARLCGYRTGDAPIPIPRGMRTEPLWRSAVLMRVGGILSCITVVTVLARAIWRARSRAGHDRTFGLALTAMLLVSPIAWDHYFLLLLLPLATLYAGLPVSNGARVLFLMLLFSLWSNPVLLWDVFIPLHQTGRALPVMVARPVHTLTVLSYQCYTILALFTSLAAVEWGWARRENTSADGLGA